MRIAYFHREYTAIVVLGVILSVGVYFSARPRLEGQRRAMVYEKAVLEGESAAAQRYWKTVTASEKLYRSTGYTLVLGIGGILMGALAYGLSFSRYYFGKIAEPEVSQDLIDDFDAKYDALHNLVVVSRRNIRQLEERLLPTMLTNSADQVQLLGTAHKILAGLEERVVGVRRLAQRGEIGAALELIERPLVFSQHKVASVVDSEQMPILASSEWETTLNNIMRNFNRGVHHQHAA